MLEPLGEQEANLDDVISAVDMFVSLLYRDEQTNISMNTETLQLHKQKSHTQKVLPPTDTALGEHIK